MRWSEERILTTHAGSLPRPPELVRLYVRRAAGEPVDPGAIEAEGAPRSSGSCPGRSRPGSTSDKTASSSARAF